VLTAATLLAVTLDDDRNVASGNADDASGRYELSAKRTVSAFAHPQEGCSLVCPRFAH
jgi:hypothetical protein